jgi:uncharacterized protein DUF4252
MNRAATLGCILTALLATGCVRLVGPEDVRLELSDQAGVKLKQETGFTVTRSGIWLARQFVDDDEVPLRGVRRVEIGVYEVAGLKHGLEEPQRLDPGYFRDWTPIVRVNEDGEQLMVLVREKKESVRAMLIVVAEPDEWVLVRVFGHLDQTLEQAMTMAFDEVERPDLYARTRRARGLDTPTEAPASASAEWACMSID